jgi:acyl carrier protein
MAQSPFTFDDLKLILSEHLGFGDDEIPGDPRVPVAEIGLDSLAVVEVQLALHRLHGFPLSDDDEALASITLGELVEQVNAYAVAAS